MNAASALCNGTRVPHAGGIVTLVDVMKCIGWWLPVSTGDWLSRESNIFMVHAWLHCKGKSIGADTLLVELGPVFTFEELSLMFTVSPCKYVDSLRLR